MPNREPLAVTYAHALEAALARITPAYVDSIITSITRDRTDGYPTRTIGATPSTGPAPTHHDDDGNPYTYTGTSTETAALHRLDTTAWLDELDRRIARALDAVRSTIDYLAGAPIPNAAALSDADYRATRCTRCDLEALTNSTGIIRWPTADGTDEALCQRHHDLEFTCDIDGCTNRALKTRTGRPTMFRLEINGTVTVSRLCTRHYHDTRG